MKRSIQILSTIVLGTSLLTGCNMMQESHDGHSPTMMQTSGKVAVAEIKPSKAATTQPANNNVTGTVTFTEMGGKVHVTAHIMGLAPNSVHGFHIHASGDMSGADLMTTGGHYNPENHVHGGPTTSPVHAGDLGNLHADATGMAMLDLMLDDISIGGAKNDILGKAVIIHGKEDDLKSQPAGNAGPRVAGGVIEMKK